MSARKPRTPPVAHAEDPEAPAWCTCGRPSLTSGEPPCPVLLALADGLEPPALGSQDWMPLPHGEDGA